MGVSDISWQLTAQRQSHRPKSWSSWPTVVDLQAQLILEFFWQDRANLVVTSTVLYRVRQSTFFDKSEKILVWKVVFCSRSCINSNMTPDGSSITKTPTLWKSEMFFLSFTHIVCILPNEVENFSKSIQSPLFPPVSVRIPACESMTDSQETTSSKAKV